MFCFCFLVHFLKIKYRIIDHQTLSQSARVAVGSLASGSRKCHVVITRAGSRQCHVVITIAGSRQCHVVITRARCQVVFQFQMPSHSQGTSRYSCTFQGSGTVRKQKAIHDQSLSDLHGPGIEPGLFVSQSNVLSIELSRNHRVKPCFICVFLKFSLLKKKNCLVCIQTEKHCFLKVFNEVKMIIIHIFRNIIVNIQRIILNSVAQEIILKFVLKSAFQSKIGSNACNKSIPGKG